MAETTKMADSADEVQTEDGAEATRETISESSGNLARDVLARNILAKLERQLETIPFIVIGSAQMARSRGRGDPDFLLPLGLAGQELILAGIVTQRVLPRQIAQCLEQLEEMQARTGFQPVLGVPSMTSYAARLCRQAHISYVDLAGDCLLCFGDLFLEKRLTGAQPPEHKSEEPFSLLIPAT